MSVVIGGSPYQWENPEREDLRWKDLAACAQTDPDIFFPEKGGSTRDAKRICRECPVRDRCLEYALENDERFGIWGGLSERERRGLGPGSGAQRRAELEARKVQVKRLHAAGQTDVEIAAALGVDPQTAGRVRRLLNLPVNSSGGVPLRDKLPSRVRGHQGGEIVVDETVVPAAPVKRVQRDGRKLSPHGTVNRWRSECRKNPAGCPGGEDGITCSQAHDASLKRRPKAGVGDTTQEGGPTPQEAAGGFVSAELHEVPVVPPIEGVTVFEGHVPAAFHPGAFGGFDRRNPFGEGVDEPAIDLDLREVGVLDRFGLLEPPGPKPATDPAVAVDAPRLGPTIAELEPEWVTSPVVPVPTESLEQLRERFAGGVYEPTGRHGGLLGDLDRTRQERDDARARVRELQEFTDQLERELGAARAALEAVRAAEVLRELEPGSPVIVQAEFRDGRLSAVRVEVPA